MTAEKPPDDKPKCPECGVELVPVNGEMPEECAKCQFPVASYPTLKRVFAVFFKNQKEEEAAAKLEEEKRKAKERPKTAAGRVASLLRKKKS